MLTRKDGAQRKRIYIPERIRQARVSRAVSQTELAESIGVSKGVISQYETGLCAPSDSKLEAISDVLDYPVHFFVKSVPSQYAASSTIFFRKLQSTSAKKKDAYIEKIRLSSELLVSKLADYVDMPGVIFPTDIILRDSYTMEECSEAAYAARRLWKLGDGPIDSMVDVMQENGVIISQIASSSDRVDAFSCWYNGVPCVFVSGDNESSVRRRMSLAHELGHLVLHSHVSDKPSSERAREMEKEAFWFADAFLMPEKTFFRDIAVVTLEHFLRHKKKWMVSVGAMVQYCRNHGLISDDQNTSLQKGISYRGWRKSEPDDDIAQKEHPYLLRQAIDLLFEEGVISENDIERIFCLRPKELAQWCMLPNNYFTREPNQQRPILRLVEKQ